MSVELISQLLTKYHLSNLVSFNEYIEKIKSQSQIGKKELQQLINESKSNLQDDFKSNLQKIIDELGFDVNTQVDNPFKEGSKVNLLDLMIYKPINAANQAILKWFEAETKKFIS